MIDLLDAYHADVATASDSARTVARMRQVTAEAADNAGRWTPTYDELAWAARRAWRQEPRCIGRWRTALTVRDRRHLTDPASIAADLVEHLNLATNDGRIRSVVTVLHPHVTIANEQLVGYAGYRQPYGTVLGDPQHVAVTEQALAAGWPGGRPSEYSSRGPRTAWDVLPLLLSGPAQTGSTVHELPSEAVREVSLRHPRHPWLAQLGLRWYAVPALASHALHLTDTVAYPVVFSGHYLSTEIACRDLADPGRYHVLPEIAAHLGLDTSTPRSLWHGHAEQILHEAVLNSFDDAGVRIADPLTEAERYHQWSQKQQQAGNTVREDWSWIVPPHAPARTAVYHRYLAPPAPFLPTYRPRTRPTPA